MYWKILKVDYKKDGNLEIVQQKRCNSMKAYCCLLQNSDVRIQIRNKYIFRLVSHYFSINAECLSMYDQCYLYTFLNVCAHST